jgi:hypothetical protein
MNTCIDYKERLTLFHIIEKGRKLRSPRISSIRTLRTRIWLESILRSNKINLKALSDSYYKDSEPTGTIIRWLKGKHAVSNKCISKLNDIYPGSEEVYNLPIFDLLEIDITRSKIKKLKNKYLKKPNYLKYPDSDIEEPFYLWDFPEDIKLPYHLQEIEKHDSDNLVRRKDILGFTAILILLREAELDKNCLYHEKYLKDAYKSLAWVCRDITFKNRWSELYEAVKDIHFNMYSSYRIVQPKRHVIKDMIFNKQSIQNELPYIDYGYDETKLYPKDLHEGFF